MSSIWSFMLVWTILILQCLSVALPHLGDETSSLDKRTFNVSQLLPVASQDPWFNPPNNSLLIPAGTVLKTRSSPYAKNNIIIGNAIDTFQVMYTTTDYNNNPIWTVTTVFIPASHANCSTATPEKCSHGLVTYELPYDACNPDAGPSYLLQFNEPYGDMFDLLTRGYFVSVPDFEGRMGAYTSGKLNGHATLDAVRAVLKVAGDWGFRTSEAKTALWGYSGGALATEFAAELAESYAPDLKLDGVVHGGLVPDVIDSGSDIANLTGFAGLVIAGIIGITTQHPEAREYVDSRLKQSGPFNSTGFYAACNLTGYELVTKYLDIKVYDYFLNGSADLDNDILRKMDEEDSTMGHYGTPKMPMFIYETLADELTNISRVDSLVDDYCSKGANILYHRNNVGGHNEEIFQGRPRVLEYLSVILDGTPAISIPKTGCKTENVTVAVNVTLTPMLVAMGSQMQNYSAVTINPLNVTVLANGSVVINQPASQQKREVSSYSKIVRNWFT